MNQLERALILKALQKHLTAAAERTNAEVRAMFQPGDRKVVYRDNVELGAIGLSKPKPSWKVTDRPAFTAWVAEHFPDAVLTRVIEITEVVPDWERQLLRDKGTIIDPVTGEVLTADGVNQTSATPAFTPDPADGILQILGPELSEILAVEGPVS